MAAENDAHDLDDQLLARMLQDFLEEAPEHLDQLNLNLIQLEQAPEDEALIDEIFRTVHTLKGSAAFVGLKEVTEVSRKMEEVLGAVRRGAFNITATMVDVMYEGLDVLTTLIDKAPADDSLEGGASGLLQRLDGVLGNTVPQSEESPDKQEAEELDYQGLLHTYREIYEQLAVLKHIVYSAVHLSDPQSTVVLLSKQIDERMSAEGNAIWLVGDDGKVVEVARNGQPVKEDNSRALDIESSEVIKRVVREQLVVWPSTVQVRELMPEFRSPTVFPIKAQPEAFGFLVVDPEESAEVEVYQFIGHFAAMILNISKLHHAVDEQRKELNEMTEILFKQNAQLAALSHVELDLMSVTDPADLCDIVVKAVVGDLEAHRAAVFLIDESSQELVGISESGGLHGIDSVRLPIDREKPIKQCIESGRVVTFVDYPARLHLGQDVLDHWVVLCFKGRKRVQGVLVAEIENKDISDSISILVNHASVLLDNLILEKRIENTSAQT